MAVYVFWDRVEGNKAIGLRCVYKESVLTQEQKESALVIDAMPTPPELEGYRFIPYLDLQDNSIQFDRIGVPITPIQFRNRFTLEEKVRLKTAVLSPEDSAIMKCIEEDLAALSEVDLSSRRLRESMAWLVAKNLITQSRCDEILGDA
ncbi:MAG: hypothetical protein R3C20_12640 [Planctomycetaceae bacterium]